MEWRTCRTCTGRGTAVTGSKQSDKNPDITVTTYSQCPICGGTGKLHQCADCKRSTIVIFALPSRFGIVNRCYECHVIEREKQKERAAERDHLDQF